MIGCPIHRVVCDGWDEAAPSASNVFAFAFLVVIPTGNLLLFLHLLFLSSFAKRRICFFLWPGHPERSKARKRLAQSKDLLLFCWSLISVL
jgi:hypothetical protein